MASLNQVEAILIIGIASVLLAMVTVWSHRTTARRTSTLNYLARIDTDQDLIEARKTFSEVTSNYKKILKFAQKDKYHSDEASKVRLVLNENEKIAIGIQFGALDGKYIRRTTRGQLINDYKVAAPYIYALREIADNPAIYHEFEELVRALQSNRMPVRRQWWKFWH